MESPASEQKNDSKSAPPQCSTARQPQGVFGDLKDHRWMYAKAMLFLAMGCVSVAALLSQKPDLRTAFLLGAAIWSFCRLYYFAFYVIEKWIDPSYRFSGLFAFLAYLIRRLRRR